MHNNKQIIKDAIIAAIRYGEKQATLGDLIISVEYTPQTAGTETQKSVYFHQWVENKARRVEEILNHRIN
jgi:hypothetical protein